KPLTGRDIALQRDIRYDKHSLEDEYPYKDTTRRFQWEKVKEQIAIMENAN
ncbi:MAG TPA: L,D-transpeptidase, partial [Porphyromonadaceae bacterium]|nr:L,D-transpeptidase [Porphyromonadaceae bacterium]